MPRRHGGSSMSSKQLARTVQDGKRVTFTWPTAPEQDVTGYLCGMDDFHWMVITSTQDTHLIHKGSAPLISLSNISTYDQEHVATRRVMEKIVGPFRQALQEQGLIRTPAATGDTPKGLTA